MPLPFRSQVRRVTTVHLHLEYSRGGFEYLKAFPSMEHPTVPLLFLLGTVCVKWGTGLRPLELGPSTHTLRERAIRGLYNDVRVECQRGDGARGTTLLRETFPKLSHMQRVNLNFLK